MTSPKTIISLAEQEPQGAVSFWWRGSKPEVQHTVDGLSKMSQNKTVSYFSNSILYQFKSEKNSRK
jgi:hypothetical protein